MAVVDFNMPFGRMVQFMVKWALASIPAFLILSCVFGTLFSLAGLLASSVLASLFASLLSSL